MVRVRKAKRKRENAEGGASSVNMSALVASQAETMSQQGKLIKALSEENAKLKRDAAERDTAERARKKIKIKAEVVGAPAPAEEPEEMMFRPATQSSEAHKTGRVKKKKKKKTAKRDEARRRKAERRREREKREMEEEEEDEARKKEAAAAAAAIDAATAAAAPQGSARKRRRRSKGQFRPFEAAVSWARSSGITSRTEWKAASKNNELPEDMPCDPRQVFLTSGWKGWGHCESGFVSLAPPPPSTHELHQHQFSEQAALVPPR